MLFMLTRQTGAIRMGYQWGRVWEGGGVGWEWEQIMGYL